MEEREMFEDHAREAESILASTNGEKFPSTRLAEAQVHATLALAYATRIATLVGSVSS